MAGFTPTANAAALSTIPTGSMWKLDRCQVQAKIGPSLLLVPAKAGETALVAAGLHDKQPLGAIGNLACLVRMVGLPGANPSKEMVSDLKVGTIFPGYVLKDALDKTKGVDFKSSGTPFYVEVIDGKAKSWENFRCVPVGTSENDASMLPILGISGVLKTMGIDNDADFQSAAKPISHLMDTGFGSGPGTTIPLSDKAGFPFTGIQRKDLNPYVLLFWDLILDKPYVAPAETELVTPGWLGAVLQMVLDSPDFDVTHGEFKDTVLLNTGDTAGVRALTQALTGLYSSLVRVQLQKVFNVDVAAVRAKHTVLLAAYASDTAAGEPLADFPSDAGPADVQDTVVARCRMLRECMVRFRAGPSAPLLGGGGPVPGLAEQV